MDSVEVELETWRASLMEAIPIGGLLSRNSIVYKWKASFRCWALREAAVWRATDLLTQSHALHHQGHSLGARILLRSTFETLAVLIYLNQLIQQVIDEKLDFHVFDQKTGTLLLGSRDGSTGHAALNIVTILDKCKVRYPGLEKLYAELSESAHPNYEGMVIGYSTTIRDEYETRFSNRWVQLYGASHLDEISLCMTTFQYEYNQVWPDLMDKLESWIVVNDAKLEATKPPS